MGINLFCNTLILELDYLEKFGIDIAVDENEVNVKFLMTTLAGDNLGLNSVLGFFESFNSTNYCRICSISKENAKIQLLEDNDRIRMIDDYDDHVVKQLGIKEKCRGE